MKPLVDCELYTFVDTAYLRGRDAATVAKQLCDGGSDVIQLRAKNASTEEIVRLAEAVIPITNAAGIALVINDHPEIARQVGATICHLGQEDFFDAGYSHVSQLSTPGCKLHFGLSTHAPEQARRAVNAEPDYIAIGPIFATPTKPGRPPVTLDYVRWAAANVTIPWFAIGGITLATVDDVIAAGTTRICVVSAILNAPDIAKACQTFRQRLPSPPRVHKQIVNQKP